MPAGKAAHAVTVELFVELALANVFISDVAHGSHTCRLHVGCSVPEQFYFTLLAAFAKNEDFIINLSPPDDDELHSRSPGTAYGVESERRPSPAPSNRKEVWTEPCRHQLVKSVGVYDFSHAERVCILGLRALYITLAGIMQLFRYLHYGLSTILVFVGIKILMVDIYKIPVTLSLG
jgi:hypothetical protein